MSTFTAELFTKTPTAQDCDIYIQLPTINRYPVLLENYGDKLRNLTLHALKAGFATLTQGPSVSPMFVSGEVITAAHNALKHIAFDVENLLVPVTLYVGFKENRLIPTVPKITVGNVQWVHGGVPETKNAYLLCTVPTLVGAGPNHPRKDHFHKRLASEGLTNAKGVLQLFNADVVTDPHSAAVADAVTAALHDAIDQISDDTMADLDNRSRNERTPVMIEFVVG